MSNPKRRRFVWGVVFASAFVVVAAVITYLVLVGGQATVRAGAETPVCGVQVGVVSADRSADLVWGDDGGAILREGERERLTAWCVIEVESIEGGATDDEDGGGAVVTLRWRLG